MCEASPRSLWLLPAEDGTLAGSMLARSSCRSLVVALAAAMVMAPTQAHAQAQAPVEEPPTGARAGETATSTVPLSSDPALEYELGTQAYALGNYEQAIAHFERSYGLSNHPYLLYNLGLAYTQWHGLSGNTAQLRKARRLFQNYINALSDDPSMDQEQRGDAEAQIARLDEQLAEIEAREAATPPKVEGPEVATPTPTPQPQPQPADAPPPTRQPLYKKGWFWGVIAVGALAIVGGVTAGVLVGRRGDGTGPELGTIGPTSTVAPTGLGLRF